jgi:acyl-CoA reductase-like NAD-dependent aldehyde dehydrogenase
VPVVLELGGKDPMIVCDDADLSHAADQAMLGVFTACGQMCVGAERIYVFADVYEEFLAEVTRRVRALRQGPPLGETVDVGAMTMPGQLDILDRLVADAVSKGARVVTGGKRNAGLRGQYFEPTILADVTHAMDITQKEQFGPIMVVMKVTGEDDAVAKANDCPYGLGSSVFSKDTARAERLARRIPFGGVGLSGFGKINGKEGLRACCNEKAMVTDRVRLSSGVAVYPIRPSTFGVASSVIELIYADGATKKARAALRAAKNLIAVARGR